jgi:hypothetical protein
VRFFSSAVTSLMACLRLVSDAQVHLVIPRDIKFEVSLECQSKAVILTAVMRKVDVSLAVRVD